MNPDFPRIRGPWEFVQNSHFNLSCSEFLMISDHPSFRAGFPNNLLAAFVVLLVAGESAGQETGPLRVKLEVAPGTHYVGQGFELWATVIASGPRPKIDPPKVDGALVWSIGTEV